MRFIFSISTFTLALCYQVLLVGLANAEPNKIQEGMPDNLVERINRDPFEATLAKLADSGSLEQGIVAGAKTWGSDPITVCFFGGSRKLRAAIVDVAASWEQIGANIKFDFGNRSDPSLCDGSVFADIRVGYAHPGYWSLVGQDSVVHAGQAEQSLNLQRFDRHTPSRREFQRVVLHEFGHALGFRHEHQNPISNCESEFNWPRIYQYLGGPPNNWPPSRVNSNMRGRPYHQGDIATDFDKNSIMLYSFPAEFYLKGTQSPCFAGSNSDISEGDARTAKSSYPMDEQTPNAVLVSTRKIESAIANLPQEEQTIINQRVEILKATGAAKAQIIGKVLPQYVDVDIFACDGDSLETMTATSNILALQPGIGRLRIRDEKYPGSEEITSDVSVIADITQPETIDANRIVAALKAGDLEASIKPNKGKLSRWYLSVVVCNR